MSTVEPGGLVKESNTKDLIARGRSWVQHRRDRRVAERSKVWRRKLDQIPTIARLPEQRRVQFADRLALKELDSNALTTFLLFFCCLMAAALIVAFAPVAYPWLYVSTAVALALYVLPLGYLVYSARFRADLGVCTALMDALRLADKGEKEWRTLRFKKKLISRIDAASSQLQKYLLPLTPRGGPPRNDLTLAAYRRAMKIRRMENWVVMPVATTRQDVRSQLFATFECVIDDRFADLHEEKALPQVRREKAWLVFLSVIGVASVAFAVYFLLNPEILGGSKNTQTVVGILLPIVGVALSALTGPARQLATAKEGKEAIQDVIAAASPEDPDKAI